MNFITRPLIQSAKILFPLLLLAGVLACNKNTPPENYLARVDNKYLTTDDLKFLSIINPDGKVPRGQLQAFLNDWTDTEILAQQAMKYDLDQDPYLQSRLNSFKKKLLADTYIRYHINKDITVPDSAIQSYYNQHKQVFMWEHDGAEVVHYFCANKDTAQQVYDILRNGSLEEKTLLYQKNHPNTQLVTYQEVIPEIGDALFGTRATGVLSPIKSQFGYHVLVVKERYKAGTYQTLDQVRDEIRERLLITAQKRHYYEVLDSLKGVVDFEINQQKYDELAGDEAPNFDR